MKIDFGAYEGATAASFAFEDRSFKLSGETDRLTDVLLCPPHYLAPVPCCAVTRQNLAQGLVTQVDEAQRQHGALVQLLQAQGVRCHMLTPDPDLADMCFTRDVGVSTPWGMVALNPAMPHRQAEVDRLIDAYRDWRVPVRRITNGTIEGGDVCVAREGLLILGMSGERSSAAGVEEFAAPFRAAGWDVLICPFHADHLHLDTIFCMVDRHRAIGCIDLLDPGFVRALSAHGVSLIPLPATVAPSLGCNILSLGDRRIVTSTDAIVPPLLRQAGYRVMEVDISQFAACGGGGHCLTQPLRRVCTGG